MEVHGGEGVLRFFQYIADRTDIALGMFNSPSSGYVLTRRRWPDLPTQIPAVVAVKEGVQDSTARTRRCTRWRPELVIWECDLIVYRAGWLQEGIVGPASSAPAGYLYETPATALVHRVLDAHLGRPDRRGHRVRQGVGARRLPGCR